jgi:hypothetical protein
MDDMLDELHYLRWWHATADFGPADGDVRAMLNADYRATGREVPAGYEEE